MNRPALMSLLNHIWTRPRGAGCRAGHMAVGSCPACSIPRHDGDDSSGALPPPGAPLHQWNSIDVYNETQRRMGADRIMK